MLVSDENKKTFLDDSEIVFGDGGLERRERTKRRRYKVVIGYIPEQSNALVARNPPSGGPPYGMSMIRGIAIIGRSVGYVEKI